MLELNATEANLCLPFNDWIRNKDAVTVPHSFNPAAARLAMSRAREDSAT